VHIIEIDGGLEIRFGRACEKVNYPMARILLHRVAVFKTSGVALAGRARAVFQMDKALSR